MDILSVANLTKKFGSFTAVDDISFSLREGEILGFLGPNGAGKTTTIQMLLGALIPDEGNVIYFGKNITEHREEILEQINFSSTYTNLPWRVSVEENLTFVAYLYNIKNRKDRIKKIIQDFKLDTLLKQELHELSAGQLTRVNLAKAFLNHPRVLLLDEPTASLDPDVANYIHEFLLHERKNFQVSIIITSHNMAEVEKLCDRVIFINSGKIISDDTPEQLAKSIKNAHVELLISKNLNELIQYCERNNLVYKINEQYVVIDVAEKSISNFFRAISEKNIIYDEVSIEKPTLEDYFLEMTKNKNENS